MENKVKRAPVVKDCKCATHPKTSFSLPAVDGGKLNGEYCSKCYGIIKWAYEAPLGNG